MGRLASFCHDEGRDTLVFFSRAGFMPSNAHDKPLIHTCRDSDGISASRKLIDKNSRIAAEVNSDTNSRFLGKKYRLHSLCAHVRH